MRLWLQRVWILHLLLGDKIRGHMAVDAHRHHRQKKQWFRAAQFGLAGFAPYLQPGGLNLFVQWSISYVHYARQKRDVKLRSPAEKNTVMGRPRTRPGLDRIQAPIFRQAAAWCAEKHRFMAMDLSFFMYAKFNAQHVSMLDIAWTRLCGII